MKPNILAIAIRLALVMFFLYVMGFKAWASTDDLASIRSFHNHRAIERLKEEIPSNICQIAYVHDCYDMYFDCTELTEHELMISCLTELLWKIKQSQRSTE